MDVEVSRRLQAVEYVLQAALGLTLAGFPKETSDQIKQVMIEPTARLAHGSGPVPLEAVETAASEVRDMIARLVAGAADREMIARTLL